MTSPPADRAQQRRRSSLRALADVASHLWGSDVHRAAIDRLDLQPGERVLDIGAGLGPASLVAAERVGPDGSVIAIEPSRPMRVAIGLRRAVSPHRRTIAVRGAVAENLPVQDQSVDAVVALNVVHLLGDHDAAATELRRVSTLRGRVLFVEEDMEHPSHTFHEPDDHGRHGRHGGHHRNLGDGVEAMATALRTAGFCTSTSRVDDIGGQPAHLIVAGADLTGQVR